jgi:hypothetical protein
MTSKFKARTENTPRLSSVESTEAKAEQSSPLAATTTEEKLTQPTTITPETLGSTLTTGKKEQPNERTVLSATMFRAALLRLKKDGLVKLYRVLSPDGTTVEKIIVELPAENWTESINLRVLSDA